MIGYRDGEVIVSPPPASQHNRRTQCRSLADQTAGLAKTEPADRLGSGQPRQRVTVKVIGCLGGDVRPDR